ncbi:MAG: sigma-70 family RNA polymerase sigma factor [Verrucomicrobia bacterium]|nr:sigma-70 family RNA polymerase sigma factor [Verrucomicrobiota bacterium]
MTGNDSTSPDSPATRRDVFVTTRWTVVLSAGRKSSPQSDRALSELCQTYWYPLYAYVRHRGHSKEDAEDLTQAFFARFLEKNYLEGLSAERGKFRAFLLASLKHFLANEWDKSQTQKRGGGALHLSLDWQSADARYHLDPPDPTSPDRLYDRDWALALLERVIARLREECAADGKAELFEQAKDCLMVGDAAIPYAQAAEKLRLNEGAVRVAVHRLRKRYRELLRDEIAQTLSDPAQVKEELRSLQAALAG